MMTDGVPQRELKAVAVMCGIVYVLNILRLVVFYPIAVDACMKTPNVQACLTPMCGGMKPSTPGASWRSGRHVAGVVHPIWRSARTLLPPKTTHHLGASAAVYGNQAQGVARCCAVAVRVGHDQHFNQSRGH